MQTNTTVFVCGAKRADVRMYMTICVYVREYIHINNNEYMYI